jgi:hypothetical protein
MNSYAISRLVARLVHERPDYPEDREDDPMRNITRWPLRIVMMPAVTKAMKYMEPSKPPHTNHSSAKGMESLRRRTVVEKTHRGLG